MSDQPVNYDQRQPMEMAPEMPPDSPAPAPMPSVPVHSAEPIETTSPVTQGTYATFYVAASTSTMPTVQKLLPADPERQHAYVMALNVTIILCTSQSEAQSTANLISQINTASASVSGDWTPPIRHKEEVWAVNTSTTDAALISVITER